MNSDYESVAMEDAIDSWNDARSLGPPTSDLGSGSEVRSLRSEGPVPPSLRLDLGSGPIPELGFTGVDICTADAGSDAIVIHHDLFSGEPWPFADGTIRDMRAHHVIEHIPHDNVRVGRATAKVYTKRPGEPLVKSRRVFDITKDAFFWFFDEAFRVAAPGCRFELAWPDPQHVMAFQDPTHTRYVPAAALNYLSKAGRHALRVTQYSVDCDWRLEGAVQYMTPEARDAVEMHGGAPTHHWNVFHEIRATLVKPER